MAPSLSRLGRELRRLRLNLGLSIRGVERQCRQRHLDDRTRRISHTYLRQLEAGEQKRPSPEKLEALAEIYAADYAQLMRLAGYLEATEPDDADTPADRLVWRLRQEGIRPEYFLGALAELPTDSLSIVHRLVTTLSVQQRARGKRAAGRAR